MYYQRIFQAPQIDFEKRQKIAAAAGPQGD